MNQAVNTLRYIEQRMEVDDVAASHGSDLYWLMQKLRILIKAIYLSQLGISIDIAKNLFERNAYYLHIISLENSRVAQQQAAPHG